MGAVVVINRGPVKMSAVFAAVDELLRGVDVGTVAGKVVEEGPK